MSLVATWIGVATGLGVLMRRTGLWWRVALGCAAWPAWPAVAGVSYVRWRLRKTRKES